MDINTKAVTLPRVSYPTANEEAALLHLLPHPHPPPPNATKLLTPILHLLQTDWIRTFLFTDDPIHITPLSSPNLSATSFTSSHSATRIDPTNLETHHLHSRFLYTPSFSVPPFTAGFGAVHFAYHVPDPCTSVWGLVCATAAPFRYVRNSQTHVMLEVMQCPILNALLINYIRLETPTRTRHVQVLCTRSSLLNALDATISIPPAQSIQPSLQYVQDEILRHDCKLCGATAEANCMCLLPCDKPRHPFDHDFFRKSMQLSLGTNESVANKLLFGDALGMGQAVLACRVSVQSMVDPKFVREVSRAVISKALWQTPQKVVRQPLLAIEGQDELLDMIRNKDDEFWREAHKDVEEERQQELVLFEAQTSGPDIGVTGATEAAQQDVVLLDGGSEQEALAMQSGGGASELAAAQSGNHVSEQAETGFQAIDLTSERREVPEEVSGTEALEMTMDKAAVADAAGETGSTSTNVEMGEAQEEVGSTGGSGGEGEKVEDGNSRMEEKAIDEAALLEERRRRARDRRERNRIAARKSNARRKMLRDGLVNELKVAKDKVEGLRGKELGLRQENLRLRKLMAQRDV